MPLICRRGATFEYEEPERQLKLFSVSQVRRVMDDPFRYAKQDDLELARIRGNAVDHYFSMLLLSRAGCAPVPVPAVGYEGYCESVQRWVEAKKIEPIRVQEPSLNAKCRVAGTPEAQIRYGPKRIVTIPDCKTGIPTKTDGVQLLAYKTFEDYTDTRLLLDLYAQADGSMAEEEERQPDPRAWAAFVGALAILHWRVAT